MDEKIMRSQEYYKWKYLKSCMQKMSANDSKINWKLKFKRKWNKYIDKCKNDYKNYDKNYMKCKIFLCNFCKIIGLHWIKNQSK